MMSFKTNTSTRFSKIVIILLLVFAMVATVMAITSQEVHAATVIEKDNTFTLTDDGTLTIKNNAFKFGNVSYGNRDIVSKIIVSSSVATLRPDMLHDSTDPSTSTSRFRYVINVTVLNGVQTIGYKAFYNLDNLMTVSLPASVGDIGGEAFAECDNLNSVRIPNKITTIKSGTFQNSGVKKVVLPAGLTQIDAKAFDGCSNLTSVNLGSTKVNKIGSEAFKNCINLSTISFPATLKTMGTYTFAGSGLRKVVLPAALTVVPDYAFAECLSLTSVTLGAKTTKIGESTFAMDPITEITFPATVNTISKNAFSKTSLRKITFKGKTPVDNIHEAAFCYVDGAHGYYPAGGNNIENLKKKFTGTLQKAESCSDAKGANITWHATGAAPSTRLADTNRYGTATAIADELKKMNGNKKFSAIIVATGAAHPDALSGGYLAKVKNGPIILTSPAREAETVSYIKNNLASGGKVYILGGTTAVPNTLVTKLRNAGISNYKRLGGSNRFATNILILKEAGLSTNQEILVAKGYGSKQNDAQDALISAATGRPVLLVNSNGLSADQKIYLKGRRPKNITIVGATSAVSGTTANQLKVYASISRISGANIYDRSVKVAEKYYKNPSCVVLAVGDNWPDALAGGPLAVKKNGPLLLTGTAQSQYKYAKAYVKKAKIATSVTLGGTAAVPASTVTNIMK